MTDTPQAPPAPPAPPPVEPAAPPATASEAATRLATLKADPKWTEALMRGGPTQTQEFHDLHALVSQGDSIDVAMSGTLPDVPNSELKEMAGTAEMLKAQGFTDLMVRETLSGKEATQAEFDMAKKWKADKFSDQEWVKRLFSGDVQARRELTTANIILNSPIKKESAA